MPLEVSQLDVFKNPINKIKAARWVAFFVQLDKSAKET